MNFNNILKYFYGNTDKGIIGTSAFPFRFFVTALEDELIAVVEDNTGLGEKYDINFYYNGDEPISIIKNLEEQLGLVLQLASKRDKVLLVTKK